MVQALRRVWLERRNKLWVLPVINSMLAVLLALLAAWIPTWLPASVALPAVAETTLSSLLTVVSSSMLAVTTFSLSIMVSAFASASNGVSPRATELVMGDEGTREAISTFLSAFIFSVVAQIALGLNYYGDEGRFILFLGTLGVLAWLIVALLRWVRTLSSLGRLGNTLSRVQTEAKKALVSHWQEPWLGAKALPDNWQGLLQAPSAMQVISKRVAMVRRLDLEGLQQRAEADDLDIHLCVRPGALVGPKQVLAVVLTKAGQPSDDVARDEVLKAVQSAIHLEDDRTFDQDPRFGLIVLREAGQRALSAAINDPGTSILCLNAVTRVLLESQLEAQDAQKEQAEQGAQAADKPRYSRLSVPGLDVGDFVRDTIDPMARDGAACHDLMTRMFKQLAMLAEGSPNAVVARAARESAQFALSCAQQQLPYESDRQALAALHRQLFGAGGVSA